MFFFTYSRLAETVKKIALSVWSTIHSLVFAKLSMFLATFTSRFSGKNDTPSEKTSRTDTNTRMLQQMEQSGADASTQIPLRSNNYNSNSASTVAVGAEMIRQDTEAVDKWKKELSDGAAVFAKLAGDVASVSQSSGNHCF